jgi:HPt (histidine-containing phosphotransfer) domain-containing protein
MSSLDPRESAVLDPQLLENLRALQDPDDPDLARELIDLFLRDSATRVAAIQAAAARHELAVIAELAHQIKGSAGVLAATRLRETASDLEHIAREEAPDLETLTRLCQDVGDAFDEVRTALARLGFQ